MRALPAILLLPLLAAPVPGGQEPRGPAGPEGKAPGERVAPLLVGFREAPAGERLRRAKVLARRAGAAHTDALAKLLAREGDSRVRLLLVHALGRRDVAGWRDRITPRVAALSRALRDRDGAVRRAALTRLAAMEEEEAARALAAEAGRPSSPIRRPLVRALAGMEAAWRVTPGLVPAVRARMPDLLPVLVGALGRRYSPVAEGTVLPLLGAGDPVLRSSAYTAFWAMDSWLDSRRDHRRRLALFDRARAAWPWNLDLAYKAALVAVLDDRRSGDAWPRLQALERLVPTGREADWAPEGFARVYLLQGIDRFLAGHPRHAQDLFRRAWNAVQAARARRPEAAENDADLRIKIWLDWRRRLDRPLDPEEEKRFRQRIGTQGGPGEDHTRHLLRLGGRLALVAGAAAHIAGDRAGAADWLLPARDALDQLEDRWDRYYLGPFGEQDAVLQGEVGVVDLLLRGLGRGGRWHDGEKGYAWLIAGLSALRGDLYLPPPGRPAPRGSGGEEDVEKAFSSLHIHYAVYLQEAGEREKALALCRHLEKQLRKRGLSTNQEYRMRVLFRLAGIYSDLRRADDAEKLLQEFMRHYQARKTEVQQHPEYFHDPKAVLRWCDGRLAQGHVSLAVAANVLRQDTARASFHCRRAFELDGRDFNRVLYACYLAREGRAAEARTLAEAVDVAPSLYYNLACTWALLGQKRRALALLRRDFAENHLTPAARNLHRDWAAKDRDLEGLRGLEGFRKLLTKER